MLKRSLLLATLALSFASSAFASFPKWKVEGAVRRGCGIGSDWKLLKIQCLYDPQNKERVTWAELYFCDHARAYLGDWEHHPENLPDYSLRLATVDFSGPEQEGGLIVSDTVGRIAELPH